MLEKSLAKLRREQMDYLGYSNIHQIPLYIILQPVIIIARWVGARMIEWSND